VQASMPTRFLLGLILFAAVFLTGRISRADCTVTGGVGPTESATTTECTGLFSNPQCPSCPGYSPALMLKHVDPVQCPTGSCTGPFFNRSGPGAITDNMFGIISSNDPGPDTVLGTGDDIPTYKCGRTVSSTANNLAGLNCGDIRFDPVSQGMTVPGGGNSLQPFTSSFPTLADFCAAGGTDCLKSGSQDSNPHMGYLAENAFHWASCSASSGPPAPPGCTTSSQTEEQVVNYILNRSGTLSEPGSGDQYIKLTTSWQTNNTGPTTFGNPEVNWTQFIDSPEAYVGQGKMIQDDSGILQYSGNNSALPVVTYSSGPLGNASTSP
jgi:hypothetical protein